MIPSQSYTAEELAPFVEETLWSVRKRYLSLGGKGLEDANTNQFGESRLRMDWEAEEIIIERCRKEKLPIRIVSEEHGTIDLSDSPELLGVIDGIDGSNVYKKAWDKGAFGTMFSISAGVNPRYDDYIVSGIMQHVAVRLLLVKNGAGSFLVESHSKKALRSSLLTDLSDELIAFYDVAALHDGPLSIFKELHEKIYTKVKQCYLPCASAWYAEIATGSAHLSFEYTRKQNLEQMVAFGILKESGAVMLTTKGEDFGPKRYFEFGQDRAVPFIVAANDKLAKRILMLLRASDT